MTDHAEITPPLVGRGDGGGVGEFFVFADDGDEGLGGAREAAVAAIDEAELAPKVDAFDVQKLYFAGLDLIACETFADERDAGVCADKTLDHADAGQLHHDAEASAIGAEELVQDLAGEAGTGKDERLSGDFLEGDLGAVRERIAAADHEAEAVARNVMDLESGRFDGKRDDADIDGAVLDALQNLVAEIAVDADLHLGIAALKLGENIRKQIEAGGFVSAENERALDDITAVGHELNGFVAKAEETLGVLEEDFAGGSELDGLGGAVQQAGAIGLFELANLRADSGLRAKNFLPGSRETLELGNVDESGKLIKVHSQVARRRL